MGTVSRVAKGLAAVVVAIGAAGCFAQSGQQALNCEELRNVLATTSADLNTAVQQALADPPRLASELGRIADRLRQQSDRLSDEELKSAMKALADDLERLSTATAGGPGASPPAPPDLGRLTQVVDSKCPV